MLNTLYITGRGGDCNTGLGVYLASLNNIFNGISLSNSFLSKDIDSQLDQIFTTIQTNQITHVIANSYGAYLLLLALMEHKPQDIKVLLLSPVLGRGMSSNRIV